MLNLKINYYSHLLLTNKYSFVIKLAIIFSIYAIFYANNSMGVTHCTNEQDPKYQDFLNMDYTYCPIQQEYNLADGRIVRHLAGKPFEIAERLNEIPERRNEFYYLSVNPRKVIISYQETYIPPHHPINGFKPEGEIVRENVSAHYDRDDIPWTLKMCNIL